MNNNQNGLCTLCGGQKGGQECPKLCNFWGNRPKEEVDGYLFEYYSGDYDSSPQALVYYYGPDNKHKVTIVEPSRKSFK